MVGSCLSRRWGWFKSDSKHEFKEGGCGDRDQDPASDARNILVAVATLLAAVTFQAGLSPPGGVWQDNDDGHVAGKAIYAAHHEQSYSVFLVSNTLSFSTSLLIIISLASRFPLIRFEVCLATASMLVTYASAIVAVTPAEQGARLQYVLIAAASLPSAIRCSILIIKMILSYLRTFDDHQSFDSNAQQAELPV